jgi:hypothetical protein
MILYIFVGYRSMFRDLEMQVAIQTSNQQLQRQLLEVNAP